MITDPEEPLKTPRLAPRFTDEGTEMPGSRATLFPRSRKDPLWGWDLGRGGAGGLLRARTRIA